MKRTATTIQAERSHLTPPDWYQIKYRHVKAQDGSPCVGKWHYGIFSQYDDDTKAYWKKGEIVIEDAVTPQGHVISNNDCWEIVSLPVTFRGEYDKFVEKQYNKAMKSSNKVRGIAVGKLFTVGVADGNAHYVITGVSKKSVKIEWRGFSLDRYVDRTLGYGGAFPKHCVEPHVGFDEWRASLRKSR